MKTLLTRCLFQHIGNQDQMNWIRERVENPKWQYYDKAKRAHIFERFVFFLIRSASYTLI